MKYKSLKLLLILLFTLSFLSSSAQVKSLTQNTEMPPHPRILLLKGEEALIIKTIASDVTWKNIHSAIIEECDDLLDKAPVERILTGRRLLDKSREALRRIFYLSYAWRTTNDVRYFNRAEKEMLAVSSFTDWNPSHFLDVAEMTMAVSIGYDWLFNSLSVSSKNIIKNAIIEKGLKPSLDSKNNGWVTASHNWNQVCNAGMTYGALAVFEDQTELADQFLSRAAKSIKLPMEDYNPDGAYPEGYSYWGYGTSFNVMYISAIEKLAGKPSEFPSDPGFYKTAGFLENMTGPTGSCFNFSDAGSRGGLHPAMFWFANRLNDPSLLWSEKNYLEGNVQADDRLIPAIMIWGAGLNINKIVPPEKNMWVGQGKNPVALMRTSWTDPNAVYVAMKGGSPKVNHAHMDVGSFIMEANGIRWAIDYGMQDYNSLESKGVNLWGMGQNSQRWEIFRYNNFVHNTLTINGQLQQVAGFAPLTSSSDTPEMLNAITDLGQVYAGQLKNATRGIAIADEQYVCVRDEIETLGNETSVRWTMLTGADVKITGNNSAELTKNGKKLIIRVTEPSSVTMKTWTTVPPHDYDAKNPGTTLVGFEAAFPANTKGTIQVLLIPGSLSPEKAKPARELKFWPGNRMK
jgi:hypothetical protein